jgi:hypothetical protein
MAAKAKAVNASWTRDLLSNFTKDIAQIDDGFASNLSREIRRDIVSGKPQNFNFYVEDFLAHIRDFRGAIQAQ